VLVSSRMPRRRKGSKLYCRKKRIRGSIGQSPTETRTKKHLSGAQGRKRKLEKMPQTRNTTRRLEKKNVPPVDYQEDNCRFDGYYDPDFHPFTEDQIRVAVAVTYYCGLKAPPRKKWAGKGGTISMIREMLDIPKGSTHMVRNVLDDVTNCVTSNTLYTGKRKPGSGGQNRIIDVHGVEAQIIADAIERGDGLTNATVAVNEYREMNGLETFTRSAVATCVNKLKPLKTKTRRTKTGSMDPTSAWCRARTNQFTQFCLRAGTEASALGIKSSTDEITTDDIPEYFNVDKLHALPLGALSDTSIAFYDEIHIPTKHGYLKKTQVRFPQSESGKLDLTGGGQYRDIQDRPVAKYTDEARMMYGVAKVELKDGTVVGRRSRIFDYTGRWLCGYAKYENLIVNEIARVKQLGESAKKRGGWIHSGRKKKEIFEYDKVGIICSESEVDKFKTLRIQTVGDLANADIAKLTSRWAKKASRTQTKIQSTNTSGKDCEKRTTAQSCRFYDV